MDNLEPIYKGLKLAVHVLYVITLVVSLVFYKRYKHTPLRYFPLLLIFTIIIESIGLFITTTEGESANTSMYYNSYHIVAFLFYFYVFRHSIDTKSFKRAITIFAVIYILSSSVNPFYQDFLLESQLGSWLIGGIFLILSVFLFYGEVLNNDKTHEIRHDPLFWIGTGLLFFHAGYIPIKIIRLYYAKLTGNQYLGLAILQLSVLIISYLCYNIGFIWSRKNT